MSFFDWFKPSPTKLLKKKKDKELIEQLKRIEFTVTERGAMTYHGISEYGARKYLEEGKEPNKWDKVLTKDGDLVSWEQWKINNA